MLDQELFQLLSKPDYIPMSLDDIAKELTLSKSDNKRMKRLVHKLLDEGSIAKVKRDRFCLPKDADLVSGTIKFRQSGSAILIPEGKQSSKNEEPLLIRSEDTWVALHGDRVLVRLAPQTRRDFYRHRKRGRDHRNKSDEPSQKYARVIRILQRAFETIPGTLKRARLFHYVIPDDPRIIQDILVPDPEKTDLFPKPREGDKVIVKLHPWEQRHLNPEGDIIEVLGKTHEPGAEFKAILHKYKLNPSFPDNIMADVGKVPTEVRKRDIKNRKDCRKTLTFTIDPDDAKDFDDALSVEYLDDGKTKIGIHIADVSAYVKHGSALDKEAQKRGNSTYLVGCVIPMLPHALSNGICSLVEAQDRLVKSVFLTFDPKGKILDTEFANSVINSAKRLTYHQAYAFLTQNDLDEVRATPMPPSHQTGSTGRSLDALSDKEMATLQKAIRKLWSIGSKLRRSRMQKGSLDLDMPEVKIFVDENGYADRLERIEYDESHQLIEEFMLIANEKVAKALWDMNIPYISRVHDEPDADKLNELRDYMITMGIPIGDLTTRSEVTRLLKKIKNHPQAYTLRIEFLRSLKQACYRAQNDGHYGLAKTFYAHFTSPIRRYSDLIVHRIFDGLLVKQGIDSAPKRAPKVYSKKDLDGQSEHLSRTEQNSTEAERDSVKTKLLEFFERELEKKEKTKFDAYITDIKNHGIFIELTESMAFGLVHISTLRDDLYRVSSDGTALIGRRQQKKFELGDTISVSVERVDRFKRQIDFRINMEDSHEFTSSSFKRRPKQEKTFEKKKHKRSSRKESGKRTKREKTSSKKTFSKPKKKTIRKRNR